LTDGETVYLGLGGNVGDVMANMAGALTSLNDRKDTNVTAVSKVYKTPPWGITEQEWFLNCCACVQTEIGPYELLDACLNIEIDFKRKRIVRWGPRSVDVDILLFGDISLNTESLTIPHPRMHERAFVMVPLADISPRLMVGNKSTNEWAESLLDDRMEVIEAEADWWRNRP